MAKKPIVLEADLKTTFTGNTSWQNVTGLTITIPEDGLYLLTMNLITDPTAAGRHALSRMAVDGTGIGGTNCRNHDHDATARTIQTNTVVKAIYMKKDQVFSAQHKANAGTSQVLYAADDANSRIQAIKLF